MALETKIDLNAQPFFKLIYNLLMQNKQQMYHESAAEMSGSHALGTELARLFTDILIQPDTEIGSTKGAIFTALKSLHELSDTEIETLMTIVP